MDIQTVLKMLLSQQARPQIAQTGVPAPLPQQQSTTPPAGMGHGWGAGMYTIGMSLQNAAARIKQQQFAEAESDWNDLTTSISKYVQPDGSIDQKAYLDPAVMNVLGNPKKLKKMAKSMNQDWLNPEKTDVYSEALKSHLSKQQQKQQAAQGLQGLMSHLIKKSQQPQMSQQQIQQMAQQVMSKAPMAAPPPVNNKEALQLAMEMLKEQDADKRAEMKEAVRHSKGRLSAEIRHMENRNTRMTSKNT